MGEGYEKDKKRRVILLVEDNQAHAELILRSLEDYCAANTIYHVSDGEEALDYMFRRNDYASPDKSPSPCLVLLDLRLPKIDGFDVLKEIKNSRELQTIPIVVLSTSEAESDIAKAYSYHANSYIVKPADFDELSELMKTTSSYWLRWNHCR